MIDPRLGWGVVAFAIATLGIIGGRRGRIRRADRRSEPRRHIE